MDENVDEAKQSAVSGLNSANDSRRGLSLFTKLFKFVIYTVAKHNIDESHGLSHAFNILLHANKIYESELKKYPDLAKYEKVIYVASIVHDACDKKYMDVEVGLYEIEQLLFRENMGLSSSDIDAVRDIISTMSYSKVKQHGFPSLGEYQRAYHIVREADLLCAYDFDRCMIYQMSTHNSSIEEAFDDAIRLFDNRVFRHNDHGLFITDYSKQLYPTLEMQCCARISHWRKILNRTI